MLKFPNAIIAATPLFTLSSCGQGDQPWISLRTEDSAKFEVGLKTFDNSNAISKSFELAILSKPDEMEFRPMLFAEHCRNVSIVAEAESLLIFYDEIALTHFSGEQSVASVSILMCDNSNSECARVKAEKAKRGARFVSVCTLR